MSNFGQIQQKILTRHQIKPLIETWHHAGKRIVFTNGCFDIVHRGHLDYLSKAADLGDVFIIGLNSDDSVSRLKGSKRPIIDQHSRALLLASFFFVTAVVLFEEDTPYDLISVVEPDILVKGADYAVNEIVGSDIVLQRGGQVVTLEYLPGFSTSAIEKKIRE